MNQFLSQAVEFSSNIIIFSLDNQYRYTSFSKTHFEVMKAIWNKEIAIGECMLDYLSAEDGYKAKINFDKALKGEHFVLIEEYGDDHFQRSYWENRYDPIFDYNKEIIGLVVFVIDISKNVEANLRIEAVSQKLTLAVKAGNIGVWEFDILKNEVVWSDELYSIFDIDKSVSNIDYQTYLSSIHPDDREKLNSIVTNALQDFKPYEVTHRVIHRNGDIKWVLGFGKIILDAAGKPIKLIGCAQDITQTILFQEELQRKNEELSKTNNELDKFVYSASHDLRAPIASMQGLIQLISFQNQNNEIDDLLALQTKSLNRMDNFIRDVINYSRNTRVEIVKENIDFNEIFTATKEQFAFYENVDKLKIKFECSIEQFYSDKTRLSIIFNNFISNAYKYLDPEKHENFLTISIYKEDDFCILIFSDNGIGIEQEYQKNIFNMFYRASVQSKGSGLGLYIVKEVIDKLRGKIHFESEFKKGTTFKIQLPLD